MKFSVLIRAFLVIAMIFATSNAVLSQKDKYPTEVFGLGASLGSMGGVGALGIYAISPDMHLGVNFGFYFQTGSGIIRSQSFMEFFPHVKYFIAEPLRNLRPFLLGGLRVSTRTESYKTQFQEDATRIVTSTGLAIYAGGEWQALSSVSLFAGVLIVAVDIDPTIITFGAGPAFIGIMFYL
jgi:hypothetical protein